ncbi:MAG: sigma-54-dependent Fis family transcriptional regulator [Planctomycetota bacterium]|nr:MAG: sigma-54-dependent Fis family transcriptional regulator [Planctomycetota bacterium]
MTEDRPGAKRALVVDDEPSICWALEKLLANEGLAVDTASSAEQALDRCRRGQYDLILLDVRLPGRSGLDALPDLQQCNTGGQVVVMTAFGDLSTAVDAVRQGAAEYLTKPFRLDDVRRTVRTVLQASPATEPAVADPATATDTDVGLVGTSAAMQQTYRQIALVADSPLPVLITGETGTGKELVAEAIHRHSSRRKAPYFAIAPVALSPELVESHLFGHVRGAFTGATEDRAGLFAQADGGTILLDEIGDLSMNVQVKLLRVLEKREFHRVGDFQPLRCDVRIISATNAEMSQRVGNGSFREDLFFRLNGMHIHLSPLRDRPEDIPALCRHFLRRIRYPEWDNLSDALIAALQARPWLGNVRELKHAVEHAAVVGRGRPLHIDDFPPPQLLDDRPGGEQEIGRALAKLVRKWLRQQIAANQTAGLQASLSQTVERELIREALSITRGNRLHAAQLLGIHRGTLREKIRAYGIDGNDADAHSE